MDTIAIRRWVAAPPAAAWKRVLDVGRLVRHDDTIEVEDVIRLPSADLTTVALRISGERWLVTVTVTAMPNDAGCGSDVHVHARRDPAARRRSPYRHPASAGSHRTAHRLALVLESLVRELDVADAVPEPA